MIYFPSLLMNRLSCHYGLILWRLVNLRSLHHMILIGTMSELPPWQGRFTLGEALVWVLSVGFMVGAKGMEVVHLISARAVVLLHVTFFNNCRTWTSSMLILRVGGESLQAVNGILTKLLDALWLPLEQSVLSYVSAFVLLDFNFQSCGEMWLQQQDYMLWNFWIQLLNVLYLDRYLKIWNCPKLKALPDYVLRSTTLEKLTITDSPILEEQYLKAGGKGWPNASHTPNITIESS